MPLLRVWLHEGHDGEPGVEAWALDRLGLATWAETREALLARIPARLEEYVTWRRRHGIETAEPEGSVQVAAELRGNEILFEPDREPAAPEEVSLARRLLTASRAELTDFLENAPPGALDWDPPYRRFSSWASWRTIRANLAHVANAETHYYAKMIGHQTSLAPAPEDGDWRDFLPRSRAEVIAFLEQLEHASDRARVTTHDEGFGAEDWSVRKALRRMVRHEIQHTKSIRRILRDYATR